MDHLVFDIAKDSTPDMATMAIQLRENGYYAAIFILVWLHHKDPKSASEQIGSRYKHGGGWQPIEGFTLDRKTLRLSYPGDPPLDAYCAFVLRHEVVLTYLHDLVAVVKPDGSFEVARID